MTKLNWEKDPLAQIVRHQKKRQTEKAHLERKAARLRKLEKQLQAPYQSGIEVGEQRERTRILSLLENELEVCTCEEPLQHLQRRIRSIKIKGEK